MNLKLIKLQLGLCACLGIVLAGEWGYGWFAEADLQENFHITPVTEQAGGELPEFAPISPNAGYLAEIIERPLFNEDRKPTPEPLAELAKNDENNTQIDDWVLNGVYTHNGELTALFDKKTEPRKHMKLTIRQQISGWTLTEIRPDRVVLQLAGQQSTVMLRKPRQNTAPPKPAKPAPAQPQQPQQPPAKPNKLPPPQRINHPENPNNDT